MRKDDLESEQSYIDDAYARLESLKQRAQKIEDGFDEVGRGGTHQAKYEKDAAISLARSRIATLNIGEQPLCFGRLDLETEKAIENQTTAYIGRLAVAGDNQEPLVIDWRAPVAEPFYRATPLDPVGVIRRRHFHMNGKTIVRIDDEVFDEESAETNKLNVVGEAALLTAVSKKRTGRMGDIVATIQREQDMAIRAPLNNVLIVTGGPGTGKTAVALHRAAYLLFTHRTTLSNSGVLLVGPSRTFLRYIDEVLPSLGEDDVHLRTIGTLRTGQKVHLKDSRRVAALKGDIRMVKVLKNALKDRQHRLPKNYEIHIDGYRLVLTPRITANLVENISSKPGTHNAKRNMFVKSVLRNLVKQYEKLLVQAYKGSSNEGSSVTSHINTSNRVVNPDVAKVLSEGRHAPEEWVESIEDRLRHHEEVKKAIERMWPILSGAELYHDLCSFDALISSAAKGVLDESEQKLLKKKRAESIEMVEWTDYDLALIDECDSLCGPVSSARSRKKNGSNSSDIENASRVIGELGLSGYMTAAELAQRYSSGDGNGEIKSDEIRTFGHVLVDEAQDLTPMQWRMIARRAQPMSMTVVGDFAQASLPGACSNWEEVEQILSDVNRTTAQTVLLSVNYRTPAEVMSLAHDVMREVSPELAQTEAVRETGVNPKILSGANPCELVSEEVQQVLDDGGTIAVIANKENHEQLEQLLSKYNATSDPGNAIDSPVAILVASDAKGLEFDHVIVVDPHEIVGDVRRPSGWKSLFVTFTRATQNLVVILNSKHNDRLAKIINKYA